MSGHDSRQTHARIHPHPWRQMVPVVPYLGRRWLMALRAMPPFVRASLDWCQGPPWAIARDMDRVRFPTRLFPLRSPLIWSTLLHTALVRKSNLIRFDFFFLLLRGPLTKVTFIVYGHGAGRPRPYTRDDHTMSPPTLSTGCTKLASPGTPQWGSVSDDRHSLAIRLLPVGLVRGDVDQNELTTCSELGCRCQSWRISPGKEREKIWKLYSEVWSQSLSAFACSRQAPGGDGWWDGLVGW